MSHTPLILASDPGAGYRLRREAINEAIQRVLDSGWYILGREVEAFEREFADYLGATAAVGVANGTDGLSLALRACGVEPGDAVITVSHTAVATVAAVEMAGAVPILADINPISYTLCPQSAEDALTTATKRGLRVKALVPVHLYGRPADMDALLPLARRHGLAVIEDGSQAHGAEINGRKVGTLGDAGVFSLYPTKNLAALGDGGVVCTNNTEIAERLRLLRAYGWRERNWSEIVGVNSRLDEMQAAVLRVRLRYLDADNAARRALAAIYDTELASAPLVLPTEDSRSRSVYHQYVVRVANREALRPRLQAEGVQTLIHYPHAVHEQPAYRGRLPQVVSLANSEAAARSVLSLPLYPELPVESARRVGQTLLRLLQGGGC